MLNIRLLANFHLFAQGAPVDAINGSPRLQALLAYLVLHHDAQKTDSNPT